MFDGIKTIKGEIGDFNTYDTANANLKKSYLYYSPLIVSLMYNLKAYIQFNIQAYSSCLFNINDFLKICYQANFLTDSLVDNYESLIILKNSALNELSTLIYSIHTSTVTYNKLSDSDTKIIEGKINKIMDALKNSESSQEEITDNKYNTLIKSEVSSSNLLSSNNVPVKSEIVHSNNLPKSKSVHFDDLILPINNQEKNIVDGYDNNNNLLADNRSYEYDAINKKKQIFSKIVGFDNHDDYDNYLL